MQKICTYHESRAPLRSCFWLVLKLSAQDNSTLSLTVHAGEYDRTETPVSTKLPASFLEAGGKFALAETTGGLSKPVAVQRGDGKLCWILTAYLPIRDRRSA